MPTTAEALHFKLDRLLCATDFSSTADRATAFAVALARRFASSVELVHVFDPSVCTSYEEAELLPPIHEREQARTDLLKVAAEPVSRYGVPCSTILKRGHSTWREILAEAQRWGADMLVVGTRSKTGVERLVIGSTAEQLIRNAECPVLTIGPCVEPSPDGNLTFTNIVLARDFSPSAAKAEATALALAEESGARVSICHVRDPDHESAIVASLSDAAIKTHLEFGVQDLTGDRSSADCEVDQGEAADAILKLAAKLDADLIVLGAQRVTFWLTHVERGVTLDVIRKLHVLFLPSLNEVVYPCG